MLGSKAAWDTQEKRQESMILFAFLPLLIIAVILLIILQLYL